MKMYKYGNLLFESIVNLKKHARKVEEAQAESKANAIQGYDPGRPIVQAHEKAKQAAINSVKNEFKKQKGKDANVEQVTISAPFIVNGHYVEPKDGYLVIGVHCYMPQKKGFFKRFFTGSMGNWFQDVGVVALKNYVAAFAGKEFAKEVTKDTVSNAIGEGDNAAKISYYVTLKIPR